jgi:uncharacterized protein YoxC
MIPTWAAVVGALSLAVIALAAVTSALAVLVVALGIRSFVKAMKDTTIPVVTDVRHLVSSIRTEVDGIAESSRDIRQRLVRAADGAEARLTDIAAAVRTVQSGVALWKSVRPARKRRPKRRKS